MNFWILDLQIAEPRTLRIPGFPEIPGRDLLDSRIPGTKMAESRNPGIPPPPQEKKYWNECYLIDSFGEDWVLYNYKHTEGVGGGVLGFRNTVNRHIFRP